MINNQDGSMILMNLEYYNDFKNKISRDFETLPEDKLKRHIGYLREERQNYIDYANNRINKIKDKRIKTDTREYDINTLQSIIEREQDVINHIEGLLKKYQIEIENKEPVNLDKGRFRQDYFFRVKEKEIEQAFDNKSMKPQIRNRWIKKEIEQLQFEKEIITKGIEKHETLKLDGWQSRAESGKKANRFYNNLLNRIDYLLDKWGVNLKESTHPINPNNVKKEVKPYGRIEDGKFIWNDATGAHTQQKLVDVIIVLIKEGLIESTADSSLADFIRSKFKYAVGKYDKNHLTNQIRKAYKKKKIKYDDINDVKELIMNHLTAT